METADAARVVVGADRNAVINRTAAADRRPTVARKGAVAVTFDLQRIL
jgi:hypothetical protein